jgi:hypothetical protein
MQHIVGVGVESALVQDLEEHGFSAVDLTPDTTGNLRSRTHCTVHSDRKCWARDSMPYMQTGSGVEGVDTENKLHSE